MKISQILFCLKELGGYGKHKGGEGGEKMFVSSNLEDMHCTWLEEYRECLCREMALPVGNEIWRTASW